MQGAQHNMIGGRGTPDVQAPGIIWHRAQTFTIVVANCVLSKCPLDLH